MGWSSKTPPNPPLSPLRPADGGATRGKARGAGLERILVVLFVLVGIFGGIHIARADPHAMFYTAIGQQQLFYNVLAALDQADYVETQFSRKELVEARAEEEATPPFEDEKFPLTEATKVGQETVSDTDPGIADLLMRSITLEGTDQYNDELVRMYGAESGRRNATSELLRALCDYGLGFEDCEYDITGKTAIEIAKMADYRDQAIVKDPMEWLALPFTHGVLGALTSGVDGPLIGKWGDNYRERLWQDTSERRLPYAYSPEIAAWRAEIETRTGDSEKQMEMLDDMLIAAASDYLFVGTEYPLANVYFDSSGQPTLENPYVSPSEPKKILTPKESAETAIDILMAPLKIREIADEAAARIALQQQIMENEGLLADATLKSNPVSLPLLPPTNVGGLGIGELSWLIENPVAVRKADVYSLPIALALLDTSQQASSLAGIDQPGSQQLVERISSSEESPGEVGGTQSVLGTLNLFGTIASGTGTGFDYDALKDPTSPSGNIIAGHLEQGAVHALRILTAGEFRKTYNVPKCGYTCY